jgi:hypothetical protein
MEMAQTKPPMWRKMAISVSIGGVVGLFATMPLIRLYDSGALGIAGASELITAFVGLLYLVLAMSVAVGVASPAFGARFLNVEEAEELREQRGALACSAAAMAAIGVMLIVLVLAGSGGIVPRSAALAAALTLSAATGLLSVMSWRRMDELMRNVSNEASSLMVYLILLVGGGWALLARLDYAPAPAPLDWLTMFFGLGLVASVVATARRGMLAAR